MEDIESVPSLENVTKCFGLVIDEHFSLLVMHPDFCEEVKSIELIMNSLASEAKAFLHFGELKCKFEELMLKV